MDNWKNRSDGMRCATCMSFVRKSVRQLDADKVIEELSHLGRCRRHAPTLSGWPGVFDSDWCGDHKLDENRV